MIDGNAQSQPLQSTALEAAVAITRSRPVALVSVIFPDRKLAPMGGQRPATPGSMAAGPMWDLRELRYVA